MAQVKGEAWLTYVVEDGCVANALIFAESLRRSKTNRMSAVISGWNVTKKNRKLLHHVFDMVFPMEECLLPDGHHLSREAQAQLHAFSLRVFDKCVFVAPTSLVVENADKIFQEDNGGKMSFMSVPSSSFDGNHHSAEPIIDLSLFLFKPCMKLYETLVAKASTNGKTLSGKYLQAWFENQQDSSSSSSIGCVSSKFISKFDVGNGSLLNTDRTHAPVIQFVQVVDHPEHNDADTNMMNKMAWLRKLENIGLAEKLIVEKWLELYQNWACPLLKTPSVSLAAAADFTGSSMLKTEPIAIIGMSCRYPGANSVKEFWDMLYQGEEGICEPAPFRWTKEHTLRLTPELKKTQAGFLRCPVDEFDAKFFGVSPKEAAFLDPQARLLHEVLWESLEDSGIDPHSLHGTRTGIFTGCWLNEYRDMVQWSPDYEFFRCYMGNSIGAVAARLSFLLGLVGPSISTESACSSSVAALHMAIASLRNGETNLALTGGVNLILHPFQSNILKFVIAPGGRCRTFDSKAEGYGRAEGCGVLVLKRLSDALRDGDNIWAMIRGSALTQEGVSRSLGTPTVHCESLAMQLAMKDAGVSPEQVSFVETHGTGTLVGDPMEVAALAKSYHTPLRKEPLIIGSVKTNVGHAESCAGVSGIMKAVLALHHELIPRHRNLEELNPEIDLEAVPAVIPMENTPWPRIPGKPRIAGVSSFGITGTDGHLIIQEAPDYQLPRFKLGLERPLHIMTVSAKSAEALQELLQRYQNIFQERSLTNNEDDKRGNEMDEQFADVAFSANTGRAAFSHRAFIIGQDYPAAMRTIQDKLYLSGEAVGGGARGKICFLFTGQGSQYQGMAKTLYETSPIFRVNFDACDRTLRDLYNLSIREVMWEADPSSKELSRTIYSQTSIFCVEYCLLKLWQSWGIHPDYVLGHSLGEFCAAVAAGILDFKDALKLVAERSRLIDSLPRGSMLVIKASKPQVEKLMKCAEVELDFAAVNSEDQTVVAGTANEIEKFHEFLKGHGMKCVILEATHAFHSRHMDPMLEEYRKIARSIKFKKSATNTTGAQYVSGMEGRLLTDLSSEMDADYWVRHTRETVNFIAACHSLKELECQLFIEVGPQPVLSTFVIMNNGDIPVTCYPSLRRATNDWDTILSTLGKLYLSGHSIDWKSFDEPYIRRKVSLPFHPFHKKQFWIESSCSGLLPIHPLIGRCISNASQVGIFQNELSVKNVPWLRDHCIGSRIIFPGAGYAEMLITAGYCFTNCLSETLEMPRRPLRIEKCHIDAPLELKEDRASKLQCTVNLAPSVDTDGHDKNHKEGFQVKVFRQADSKDESGKWIQHASATFHTSFSRKDTLDKWKPERIREIMDKCEASSPEALYKRSDSNGLKFSDTFKSCTRLWSAKVGNLSGVEFDEVVSQVPLPEDVNKYLIHPILLDAMFQTMVFSLAKYQQGTTFAIPIGFSRLTVFPEGLDWNGMEKDGDEGRPCLLMHSWIEENKPCVSMGVVAKESSIPIALFEGIDIVETNVRTIESVLEQQSRGVPDAWEEVWKVIPGSGHGHRVDLVEEEDQEQEMEREQKPMTIDEDNQQFRKGMDRMVYLYILKVLYELGWVPEMNESFSLDDFCQKYGIITGKYEHLMDFYLKTVEKEEKGNLEWDERSKTWLVSNPPSPQSLEQVFCQLDTLSNCIKGRDENGAEILSIYETISASLVKILKGDENAMSVLFPESSEPQRINGLDEFQKRHSSYLETQKMAVTVVNAAIEKIYKRNSQETGKIIRILEVGASGSWSDSPSAGTKCLLEHVSQVWGDNWEYTYTENSTDFLTKAQFLEEYKDNLKLTPFEIHEHPLDQGIPLNYFDVVVVGSINMDFALRQHEPLKQSVGHLRQVLKENGVLCFMDVMTTSPPPKELFFVWGLFDNFWNKKENYDDKVDLEIRSGGDSYIREQTKWRGLLSQYDFKHVKVPHCSSAFACVIAQAASLQMLRMRDHDKGSGRRGTWVVFATEKSGGATRKLCEILYRCGYKVISVYKSCEDVDKDDKYADRIIIQADNPDASQVETVLKEKTSPAAAESIIKGVIYGWAMDLEEKQQSKIALPFMHIAKVLLNMTKPPKLYVITQGVQNVSGEELISNPTAATLYGMAKSLKNECFELSIKCVDVDGTSTDQNMIADHVMFEICMDMGGSIMRGETAEQRQQHHGRVKVGVRGGIRYEPRFVKAVLPHSGEALQLPPGTDRFHLAHPPSRLIKDLAFEAVDIEQVKDEYVEVKVKSYALNLKDILTIVKPIPEFEKLHALGLDFSGVITRVGTGVNPDLLKLGDHVVGANCEGQFPSYLYAHKDWVTRLPEKTSCWEASTLPLVFSTAFYSLFDVAKLKQGETVLIHTGAGGVGMSAIQIAMYLGATVITTAGNARKRSYLKGIGIKHVFHSRNTMYEQEISKVTNGRGVDVVLNSLTGPQFKEATLRSCAEGARWVEISKIAIWSPAEIRALRPDVDYTIVDVTDLESSKWQQMCAHMKDFVNADFIQYVPYARFDALNVRQALSYFQKAKHIGKLICVMPEVTLANGQYQVMSPLFNDQSTYLITGGLGGIGFEVCKWMLERGATDVVLVGRNAPSQQVAKQIKDLHQKATNVNVMVILGDVGEYSQCEYIISEIARQGNPKKPLRGVMHSAGVLRDNLYGNQSWHSFEATFRSKVSGTWNLHGLTMNLPLEHFVMFSSLTAMIGTPGQPNHSAANCFEDAFAHYRWGMGLPATTVNWGQWAQVGCAKELTLTGVLPVSVKRMLNGLEVLLKTPYRLQTCFSEFESFANLSMICPQLKSYLDPRLWKQVNENRDGGMQGVNADQFWKEMDECPGKPERVSVVSGYLKKILRASLRLEPTDPIDDNQNIRDLGADSLMLMELKNSIQSLFGGKLQITSSMLKDCNTVRELAISIVDGMDGSVAEKRIEPMLPDELLQLVEKDCELEEDIGAAVAERKRAVSPSRIKTVLVTGSTGQLGPYILSKLCDDKVCPAIEKIFCLIRSSHGASDDGGAPTPEEKLKRILESVGLHDKVNMERIVCLQGDVTQRWLGLSETVYTDLCQEVDGVIHCAVKSDHMEPYTLVEVNTTGGGGCGIDTRSVNVLGTKNVLRFAGQGKTKHVYHASIFSSIFGGEDEATPGRMSASWVWKSDLRMLVEAGAPGYPISKVVCELLMKAASEDRGIPCNIFRFPWISGSTQSGQVDHAKNHYILRFLTYLKLKMIPAVAMPANLLPVDTCAELSLRIFFMEKEQQALGEIFNVCHPCPELEQEFARVAKEEFNTTLEIVEFSHFSEALNSKESPLGVLKELYTSLEKDVAMFTYSSLSSKEQNEPGGMLPYIANPQEFFKNDRVEKLIPRYADTIDSSMEIVKRDLIFLREHGVFEKFSL